MTGGEILLEAFKANNIDCIFCAPGSEWVSLLQSLAARHSRGEKEPRYINCRHETLAVAMAVGYSRTTGKLPAVILHANVGPLHAAMAIRAAHHAETPMLICSGVASEHGDNDLDPVIGWIWISRLADTSGADSLVKGYVKWSERVIAGEALPDAINRSCQLAQQTPKGPVFVAISWPLLVSPLGKVDVATPLPPATPTSPQPHDLQEVARSLIESEQPVIITEHGARTPQAVSKLVELAEILSIPVFEGVDPKVSNFPPEHPLYQGSQTGEALETADTVLIVGATTPWYPPPAFPKNKARVILIDEDPFKTRLPCWNYKVDMKLSGDTEQWLIALVNTVRTILSADSRSEFRYQARLQRWQKRHEQMVEKWHDQALAEEKSSQLSSIQFLYRTNKLLPENSLILDETVSHNALVRRYLARPGNYLKVGSGGLGIGLGVAAGVKLAYQDRPVLFFVGDGTFNYSPVLAAFGAFQEYHLPVLTIILNNGGYQAIAGSFRRFCADSWSVRSGTYLGVDITPQPDYTKIAEAFDFYCSRITEPKDIEPVVTEALKQLSGGRSGLLDVIFEA